jgi:hypothetical protein
MLATYTKRSAYETCDTDEAKQVRKSIALTDFMPTWHPSANVVTWKKAALPTHVQTHSPKLHRLL